MPKPLDYRNPKTKHEPSEPVDAPSRPPKAIPIEFDALLTQTDDHAAVAAIEAALRRAKIDFFVSDDRRRPVRLMEAHVRSKDHVRASQIAVQIFVRRQKIKRMPREEIPPDDPPRMVTFPGPLTFFL